MSELADKLAQRLIIEGEKTTRFFIDLPPQILDKSLYSDGASWTVREVLADLVETESALPSLFKNIVEGGSGITEEFDLNEYNERTVAGIEERDPTKLVKIFSVRREQTIAFVQNLSDQDLSKQGYHPFLGQAELKEMIRLFYLHVQLHIRDVRSVME